MGGSLTLRKVFGLKPKSSSANLQHQQITPDNCDLTANGGYPNNGGYNSYNPNGSSGFASNNLGQPPGLSSIYELPANEYVNGYTHQGYHQHSISLPVEARPSPNPQYPQDPNSAYNQYHDRNLSPQDAVHHNGSRDRRSASLGKSSNSSSGRSSVTTMSPMSSAATSPGPGPAPPRHLSHAQSQGYLAQTNSPRYPGQPVHGQGHGRPQAQPQEHEEAKHRNFTNPLSSRHRTTNQQYPPRTNVLHKPVVQPPYPFSERGSHPLRHSRSSHSVSGSHNLQSFAHRTLLHPAPLIPGYPQSTNPHTAQAQQGRQNQQQEQPQFPSAADIRHITKLLRRMFELRLELWALAHAHETDQHLVVEKQGQVNAVLEDILKDAGSWQKGQGNWTDEELPDIYLVWNLLREMSGGQVYGIRPG